MFQVFTTDELIRYMESFKFTRTIKNVHIHHTWVPTHKTFEKAKNTGKDPYQYLQQSMKTAHLKRGFNDIAQQLTLFPDGIWVVGRDFNTIPASIQGYNAGGFAIEMLGNFDIEGGHYNSQGYDKLEGAQKEAILKFLKYTTEFRNWGIMFHREHASKTCPGTGIDKTAFVKEVKEWGAVDTSLKVNLGKPLKFNDYYMVNNKYYVSLREVLELLGYTSISADVPNKTINAQG